MGFGSLERTLAVYRTALLIVSFHAHYTWEGTHVDVSLGGHADKRWEDLTTANRASRKRC